MAGSPSRCCSARRLRRSLRPPPSKSRATQICLRHPRPTLEPLSRLSEGRISPRRAAVLAYIHSLLLCTPRHGKTAIKQPACIRSNIRSRASAHRAPSATPVTSVPTSHSSPTSAATSEPAASHKQKQFGFHAIQNSLVTPQFIRRTSHSKPSCAAQQCCVILETSAEQTASLGHIVGA